MNVPDDLKYTTSHEWVRDDGDGVCTVGISDFAQAELTELVYVELPDSGREVEAAEDVAVVESVKSASDIYSPVAGEIVDSNQDLVNDPSTLNNSPYEAGWLFKVKLSNPADLDGLLSPEAYREHIS